MMVISLKMLNDSNNETLINIALTFSREEGGPQYKLSPWC